MNFTIQDVLLLFKIQDVHEKHGHEKNTHMKNKKINYITLPQETSPL